MTVKLFRVAVEGPADKKFWDGVFRRHFRSGRVDFQARQFGGRPNLIAQSLEFLNLSRSRSAFKTLFILDRHRDPCVTAVIEQFPRDVAEADDVEIFIAVPGIEAWYLADKRSITDLLPGASYAPPPETGSVNPKHVMKDLLRQYDPSGRTAYKKNIFSSRIGRIFSPPRASSHSASLARTWARTRHLVEDP